MMDMSSLTSIRTETAKFLAAYDGPIDILINNAGVGWLGKRIETDDGLEMTMATNHFGPFLFTHLLMDRLRRAPAARVVTVSSVAHLFHELSFGDKRRFMDDINFKQQYDRFTPYNVSKLCNILFTRELQRRFAGTKMNAYSLHPGSVQTKLFRHFPLWLQPGLAFMLIFAKTPEEGAQTTLYCALSDSAVPGEYHWDCARAYSSPMARNHALALQLWTCSEKIVNVDSAKFQLKQN